MSTPEFPLVPDIASNPNNLAVENDEGGDSTKYNKRKAYRGHPVRITEDKRMQSSLILAKRIATNVSQEQLAKEFNMSKATLAKRLQEARADDLTQLAREMVADKMLAKALGVLNAELDAGNYKAAKDVLQGMQVLVSGGKSVVEHRTSGSILDQIRRENSLDAEVKEVKDE